MRTPYMGIWRRLYGFQTLDRIEPGITLGNMKNPKIYKADKIEKSGRILIWPAAGWEFRLKISLNPIIFI